MSYAFIHGDTLHLGCISMKSPSDLYATITDYDFLRFSEKLEGLHEHVSQRKGNWAIDVDEWYEDLPIKEILDKYIKEMGYKNTVFLEEMDKGIVKCGYEDEYGDVVNIKVGELALESMECLYYLEDYKCLVWISSPSCKKVVSVEIDSSEDCKVTAEELLKSDKVQNLIRSIKIGKDNLS